MERINLNKSFGIIPRRNWGRLLHKLAVAIMSWAFRHPWRDFQKKYLHYSQKFTKSPSKSGPTATQPDRGDHTTSLLAPLDRYSFLMFAKYSSKLLNIIHPFQFFCFQLLLILSGISNLLNFIFGKNEPQMVLWSFFHNIFDVDIAWFENPPSKTLNFILGFLNFDYGEMRHFLGMLLKKHLNLVTFPRPNRVVSVLKQQINSN
jgi:hypothetical protein